MKKALIIAVLLFATTVNAQVDKTVESKISQVTVFLSRAQITRVIQTRVEAGKTNLILSGLTANLDPQSVQVAGKGGIVLLGISHQQNFVREFNYPPNLRILRDSLEVLKTLILNEQNQKEILNKEEQLILSNQKIGGGDQNLTATELKAMADFFRARLSDIYLQRAKIDERIRKFSDRLTKLQQQFNEVNDLYNRNTSELVISVSSESGSSVELEVNYIVNNAGWIPVYDIRALDTKKPVQLSYKANVFQSTGEEWKNVKLNLSTQNPNLGGVKPNLDPWFLDFSNPVAVLRGKASGVRKSEAPAPAMARQEEAVEMDQEISTVSNYTSVVQTSISTEFSIKLPYSVSSSGKPTLVDIGNHSLNAEYLYSVAPKLDNDAFLLARVTGWGELNLLPGDANVFFEGTYVTKTFINPNEIKDTLSISLGRDKRVVVQREKLKDFTSRKTVGTNQRDSYAYQISVRNTKSEPIKILIEDQIPVSQNGQIEVTLQDAGAGKYTQHNGRLEWEMVIAAQETKKVVYKFEVKYPKDKIISNLF
jgi:uncharacterized protein (TIGR02231 family)